MGKIKLEKIEGIKLFEKVGLPVLPYKILSKKNFEKEIKQFLEENELSKFMIRTDGLGRFTPSINNAKLSHLKEIKKFFDEGYTVFIMHPSNTYRNSHSLNVMKENNEIIIEIVGHGFMSTDMNRYGHLHEEIILNPNDFEVMSRKVLISDDKYGEKVKKKIQEHKKEDLIKNKSYLLEYEKYVPLNDKKLKYIIDSLPKMEQVSKSLDADKFVASMGFIDLGDGKDQPIFWDLYGIK